jgi:cystathionine beta-lyase/cystathionine gamma-synthase
VPGLGVDNTFATPLNQRPLTPGADGTIISFDVRGDDATADAVCVGLQLIEDATRLGAIGSSI